VNHSKTRKTAGTSANKSSPACLPAPVSSVVDRFGNVVDRGDGVVRDGKTLIVAARLMDHEPDDDELRKIGHFPAFKLPRSPTVVRFDPIFPKNGR
jgi:hypothetical protein